jgi:hypothetical protein
VGQWRLQSKTIQLKLLLLETNTNTFIEIVIRLHLENFNKMNCELMLTYDTPHICSMCIKTNQVGKQ